jgi:mono/diheme cytochrome c family protein
MLASEKTRLDTKLLNLVFGIVALGLFFSTLWLLAVDHYRQWKNYQRQFQEIENWTLISRDNEQQTENFTNSERELQAAVSRSVLELPSKDLVDQFMETARAGGGTGPAESQLAGVQAAYEALAKAIQPSGNPAEDGYQQLVTAANAVQPYRETFFAKMDKVISAAKFVEDDDASKRKFRRADLDATKSKYDLGVRDQVAAEDLKQIRSRLSEIKSEVATLTASYQAANQQRKALETIKKELMAGESAALMQLANFNATRQQLQSKLAENTAFGRGLLELPIIDAFGRPLQIDQIWLPNLTLNNNFRDVARFDRCITCHQGIDQTAPGSAVLAGVMPQQDSQIIELPTPSKAPAGEDSPERTRTQVVYGFELSEHGLIHRSDVLVEFVWPRSLAAVAGLQAGDVITHIRVGGRDEKLVSRADALRYLVRQVPWGQPLQLTIQRGFPHPYSSHPRLDLFVGSMSPHKMQEMGCTICHEGQGSATEFKWASHTPNDMQQAEQWREKYGWFDNHHWVLPMLPNRFLESSCLKCHHQVAELEPSERFPDPPAPQLVEGYELVQYYGCFGCHEVNGYDGPQHRIGPDLRNEPPYFAAAQQVDFELSQLTSQEVDAVDTAVANSPQRATSTVAAIRQLAQDVSYHPGNERKRRELLEILESEAGRQYAAEELLSDPHLTSPEPRTLASQIKRNPEDLGAREKLIAWLSADQQKVHPELSTDSHKLIAALEKPPEIPKNVLPLIDLLGDVEAPGTMRKVGPSLRYVGSKLGMQTLVSWIKRPQSIRPSSKMPAFFGLHEHVEDFPDIVAETRSREEIEIRAAAHYLNQRSQPFAYAAEDPRVTEEPDIARGKVAFEVRGCLACHLHDGTPQGNAIQGPNLSNLAKKINTEKGKHWLRSWLLQPDRYHRRTKMPMMFLDPEPLRDAVGNRQLVEGSQTPRLIDPAADITAYLLGPTWSPIADDLPQLSESQTKMLDTLALEYLKTAFAETRAEEYLREGIPQRLASSLKGPEQELVGAADANAHLLYVGRRTISKYGCAGCHDIPGMEAEKPVGTALADWGRKEPSKLAFEHIVHYVEKKHTTAPPHGKDAVGDAGEAGHDAEHALDLAKLPADESYFMASLMHHQREGFLRQKLLEPRSYDYEKVANKGYNDRLRMPQFPWAAGVVETEAREKQRNQEIEAIMTFVLGLVAEPPGSEYIYKPKPRREAIVQGEQVLKKFNCAGCHVLELGRWDIAYRPGDFGGSESPPVYPFLKPKFSKEEIYPSQHVDWRGMLHSTLRGMERVDQDGYPEEMAWDPEEEEFLTLEEYKDAYDRDPLPADRGYSVELWKPTYLDGHPYLVKDPLQTIPAGMVQTHYPAKGGDFARLLLPIAVELVRQTEPTADGTAALAWVPPPLVGQGRKTQEPWLTEFLLNPYPIRPGVLLRMPKFNLSHAEATSLVQYFSAHDNPDYPGQFVADRNEADLAQAQTHYQQRLHAAGKSGNRLEDALKIVINKAGCITCHAVNDQMPEGGDRANGPNLGDVHRRLQPSYLKRWIAKPSWLLPYTKMQEMIPYKPDKPPTFGGFELPALNASGQPIKEADGTQKFIELYHGTSWEQLQAVVDLLSNFGSFVESQTSMRERTKELSKELGNAGEGSQ